MFPLICTRGQTERSASRSDDRLDHTTGDFCAGVAGWLGCKIIGLVMNDNGPSDYLIYRKAAGQEQGECKPVIFKQWWQVSGVVRMFTAVWVIMGHGVGKWIIHISAAVGPFVDVKPEHSVMTGQVGMRKPVDLSPDDHAF